MKLGQIVFTLLMLTGVVGLSSFANAGSAASSGCSPNGNRFNLEPLVNTPFVGFQPFLTQGSESLAVLPQRGGNGNDLVVGAAQDARSFGQQLVQPPFSAFYVQRDNASCAADFEGLVPLPSPIGEPAVAADPARDAFFIATIFITQNLTIGIVKSAAATLLNGTSCPNGTQSNPAACWPIAGIANPTSTALEVENPTVAVDERKAGTGNGDVYVAANQESNGPLNQIILSACTNSTLACGQAVIVSGGDGSAFYPTVQVRPDGIITVSYVNHPTNAAYQFKFATCTPAGAPNPPVCGTPVLVESTNNTNGDVGDSLIVQSVFARHIHRLESDGKTVTTFLVYDQCTVQLDGFVCPQSQVVLTYSIDDGNTWAPLQTVGPAAGQQFLGNLALDTSTGTVNIAYYSTQNDTRFKIEAQIFLAQIPPGQTTAGPPHQVTDALFYGPFGFLGAETIGVAAGGTGTPGQSHVYIHFTGSTTKAIFNDEAFPIIHNVLTRFDY